MENNKFCVSVHYRNVDEKVGVVLTSYFKSILFQLTADPLFFFITSSLELFQCWMKIAESVDGILKDYPRLRLTHGRKVSGNANLLRNPNLKFVSCSPLILFSVPIF